LVIQVRDLAKKLRAEDLLWRDRFVLEVAKSKVDSQAEKLDNLRSNAGVLLGAINVGIAVLAQSVPGNHVSWKGVVAFAALLLAVGALLLILWPQTRWGSGLDPAVICAYHRRPEVDDESVLNSFLDSLVKQCSKNDTEFSKLHRFYRMAIVLLFLGTIFVVLQGGDWSS
jgi:hypothetical protein